jgi:uncharacterized oxidoreductase
MNTSNNKILITGGASGIGLGLTAQFIRDNNTVIICGRRQEALNEVSRQYPGVITRQCDLEVEAERTALFNWVAENHSDLNVLVNNAGIQNQMKATDDDFFERAIQEVGVNIFAPLHLTTLFLRLKSLTTIINITSSLAFVPLTKVPVYSATKAFFHSFTLSLRHQLKHSGIEVIDIIPPKLNTDLGGKGLHTDAPEVSEFLESVFEQLGRGSVEISYGLSLELAQVNNATTQAHFSKLNAES